MEEKRLSGSKDPGVYDVIFVGGGAANTAALLHLLWHHGYDGKVLLLERGKPITERDFDDPHDIVSGFPFGSGQTSDCKMVVSKITGGSLCGCVGMNSFNDAAYRFVEQMSFFNNESIMNYYRSPPPVPPFLHETDFEVIRNGIIHIGTEFGQQIGKRVYNYLVSLPNLDVHCKEKVLDIDLQDKRVFTDCDRTYRGRTIVIGTGKASHDMLQALILKYKLEWSRGEAHVGTRVEVPRGVVKRHIDLYYDFKYILKLPSGDARSFCACPGGQVRRVENYGIYSLNGAAARTEGLKTDRTNFAIIVKVNLNPDADVFQYLYNWGKRINDYHQPKDGIVKVSWKTFLTRASLRALLGHSVWHSIYSWCDEFQSITPEFLDTVQMQFPEIKFATNRPTLTNTLQLVDGVYIVGETTGLTRGLWQSVISGICCVEGMVKEL